MYRNEIIIRKKIRTNLPHIFFVKNVFHHESGGNNFEWDKDMKVFYFFASSVKLSGKIVTFWHKKTQEKPMHPQRVTVWCWQCCYSEWWTMITDFLSELDDMDVDMWLYQDGATWHIDFITREVPAGRNISRNRVVNWPPRSCDLTILGLLSLGLLISKESYVPIKQQQFKS